MIFLGLLLKNLTQRLIERLKGIIVIEENKLYRILISNREYDCYCVMAPGLWACVPVIDRTPNDIIYLSSKEIKQYLFDYNVNTILSDSDTI